MAKHTIELTEPQLRLINGLIMAEARRLGAASYQRPNEYPPRLKKIATVWRKLNEWRYDFKSDGTAVARGSR